mgnify:CR=1 FL=1
MIFKLIMGCMLSSLAWGFDKDFTAVNDRVPLEFVILFDTLKSEIKTPSEKIKLIGLTKDLNENLGFLQKEHIFLLMKSEVMKNVLEHRFSKVRQFDVTNLLIKRLEEDFAKKERYLNRFSQWIWRSIIAELKHRQGMGLITDRSFNAGQFEGAKRNDALRFQRYLTYLLPWVDKMDSLNPVEFNQLSKQVSWITLRRINERSLLFKRYASTATSDTKVTLFNIPQKLLDIHPEEIKRMQKDETDLSLKEMSEQEKTEASKTMDEVTPEDLSPVSDELAKELEKKTQESKPAPLK